MYAVITTEEYKKLLFAEIDGEACMVEYHRAVRELNEVRGQLDNLLLFITKGAKFSQWSEGKFEGFDLARDNEIANYINENFMKNGTLTVKEKNND
jgi:hypothetical protein